MLIILYISFFQLIFRFAVSTDISYMNYNVKNYLKRGENCYTFRV